jgi:hypothetical protein
MEARSLACDTDLLPLLAEFERENYNMDDRYSVSLVLVYFTLFANIVMLNMLIAQMADSYNRVRDTMHDQQLLMRAQLIIEEQDQQVAFDSLVQQFQKMVACCIPVFRPADSHGETHEEWFPIWLHCIGAPHTRADPPDQTNCWCDCCSRRSGLPTGTLLVPSPCDDDDKPALTAAVPLALSLLAVQRSYNDKDGSTRTLPREDVIRVSGSPPVGPSGHSRSGHGAESQTAVAGELKAMQKKIDMMAKMIALGDGSPRPHLDEASQRPSPPTIVDS